MISTIERYIFKETTLTFAATLAILLLALLSQRLVGLLGQAASGLLAKGSILLLLGLKAIELIGVLLPAALLLAIMLALGRLYRDSEMVALAACGYGPLRIYRALFWLAVPTAGLVALLTLVVIPHNMELQYRLMNQARKEAEITVFNPGVFREVAKGQHSVYVGSIGDEGKDLQDIFIRSYLSFGIAITTAKRGYQQIDNTGGVRYLVLEDGYRYEGDPRAGEYNSVSFKRLTVRIDSVPQDTLLLKRKAVPTKELLGNDDLEMISELQQRFSHPVAVFLLTLLAPLLAKSSPRDGRYGKIVTAIMIYAIYFNLITMAQTWLKHDVIPSFLGLWWVHALLLLYCAALWLKQNYKSLRSSPNTSFNS